MNEIDKRLVAAMRTCTSRKELEDTFDLFSLSDLETRYNALLEAMYKPEIFFSCENPVMEQRYELAMEMFLTMTWKMSELYEKMGIH